MGPRAVRHRPGGVVAPGRAHRTGREPHREGPEPLGLVDAHHAHGQPGRHAAATDHGAERAHQAAPAPGPLRLLLGHAPLQHLPRPGPAPRLAVHLGGHRGAPVHHRRLRRVADPPLAGVHLHPGVDPSSGEEMDAPAPGCLPGRTPRRHPLLLAREGRHPGTAHLRRRVRRSHGTQDALDGATEKGPPQDESDGSDESDTTGGDACARWC